jgi:hypothetical protein
VFHLGALTAPVFPFGDYACSATIRARPIWRTPPRLRGQNMDDSEFTKLSLRKATQPGRPRSILTLYHQILDLPQP